MSKISISGNIEYSKEQITQQIIDLIKGRLLTIKEEMKSIENDLTHFKNKYNLSNKEFLTKFQNENLGDKEDYFVWESSVKLLDKLRKEYQLLKAVL
ncbi:MAG: hypothetical protein ACTSYY_03630 [Promethearchaeota archaeon]